MTSNRTLILLALLPIYSAGFTAPRCPPQMRGASFVPSTQVAASVQDSTEPVLESSPSSRIRPKIVLVAGFESFNREIYQKAAADLDIDLQVFADSDIRLAGNERSLDPDDLGLNPSFADALQEADAFVGSLIFDYDDVLAVKSLLPAIKGPRLVFESATELMEFNSVGSFNMMKQDDGSTAGPPPAIKALLSKFGSGKEEDKLSGYLKLLKVGPDLLKYVPGDKAGDLRTWLEAYRYWNQGGALNVKAMLEIIGTLCQAGRADFNKLPELQVTPDIGLIHPLRYRHVEESPFFESPKIYLSWRLSDSTKQFAKQQEFRLASDDAPRVAILLYRKHVITEQRYLVDMLTIFEQQGIMPIPIFINGVEAHTIVRDLLTSDHEAEMVRRGKAKRPDTYQASNAVSIEAIVNTIGFPLVGGPAGSMETGRNVDIAKELLVSMNVPYMVAGPLLLQSIPAWRRSGVMGLQSVVLYALPELDGAVDTVVLGGLVGDKIALVPERVRKLVDRIKGWVRLRRKPPKKRKIALALYGFPPNVGAVGTAALLDVPRSLDALLTRLHSEGYHVGEWPNDPDASGESIVAALAVLAENSVVMNGAGRMQAAVDAKVVRAAKGDATVAATLGRNGGGLGGAQVLSKNITPDELERMLGKYMSKKVRRVWSDGERGPGVSANGDLVIAGLQLGNVWLFVQPLLGIEGDPMRLLFEKDLTPHPQYCASYKWIGLADSQGGFGADAIVHFGMHGTVEWLPGLALGNDRKSWSDELLGDMPNIYAYAGNNPSESILAKRRGYATIVSYNVPPYGRSGLYLELASLKDVLDEYKASPEAADTDLFTTIYELSIRSGIATDVPLLPNADYSEHGALDDDKILSLCSTDRSDWISRVSDYLAILQGRLFSSGLHVFGSSPSDDELLAYLSAYFGGRLDDDSLRQVVSKFRETQIKDKSGNILTELGAYIQALLGLNTPTTGSHDETEAMGIVKLLDRSTEELDNFMTALSGGFVPAAPGGDLLRDGKGVLPTGRNIYALDSYRMPSAGAWVKGKRAAEEILRQHKEKNDGLYPETIAVTLWGLDSIKTKGESVAIVLALVGAQPVKEGTGRIVRYDLIPLENLGRPRIDVLASLSGIFRDNFANIVDLLDDMFERAAEADEPIHMNFVKKHSVELLESGVTERVAARLFSNPPGDYGSMVNEVVGTGEWEDKDSLGEIWKGRNNYSYGRKEGSAETAGKARPEILDKLLSTTDRVVQEIDSVEYGLSDIQEYYANTGALKLAAENRKGIDSKTGQRKRVAISVIEAFGIGGDDAPASIKNIEEVLRLEYRSKLLNPKWRDKMLNQGSGGAYEISQRMTAMVGWGATAEVDNFVFDQAAERYALDGDVAEKLQRSNPEAYKNVVRRLLEAAGRGMWSTDDDTLEKLRNLYADADDLVEQASS